jgi:hypothetical protein
MELDQLHTHSATQPRVEIGEWLIKEEQLGASNDRSTHRHTLSLPAAEVSGTAIEQILDPEKLGSLPHAPLLLGAEDAADAERKREVLPHRQMRVKGIALKDERDVSLAGLGSGDVLSVDSDSSLVERLQTRDDPEKGRFSAAGGAHDDTELSVFNAEGHRLQRGYGAEPP